MLSNGLAKSDARLKTLAHFLQRFFSGADRAHAVMDAAWSKAPLRDLEAATFAKQHVRRRNAHIFQFDFHMAMRRVIISEHRQMAQNVHARRIKFHQDHGLLRMALGFEIGLAHDNRDFTARVACTRRPPLDAIQHIFVAFTADRGFDVGCIRRCHGWLRHQERRTDFAVHQREHPLFFLFSGSVAQEHFHISGVRRGTVIDFR